MVSKLVFNGFELNAENFLNGITYRNSVNAEKDLYFRTVGASSINFEVLDSTLSQTAKNGLVEGATCKYYYKYSMVKTQSVNITNIVKNGNFVDDTGWDGSIQSIDNNIATATNLYQDVFLDDTNKYYISFHARSTEESNMVSVSTDQYISNPINIDDTWDRFSLIDNIEGFLISFNSSNSVNFEIKEIIIINLTASGLEDKTASELDELIPEYFDGTEAINIVSIDDDFSKGKTYTIKGIERIRNKIRVSAYDDLHRFDVDVSDWLNGLSYPKTISSLFVGLCTHLDLPSSYYGTLPNISFSVKQNINAQRISGRIVLQFIAELTNSFVYVDNNRTVRLANYQDKGATLDNTKYSRFSRADYRVSKIDKVQIKSTEYDIGSICGNGENALVISENPFAYAESSSELNPITENIYNNIKDFDYFPFEIELFQDFEIEVGDIITIDGEKTIVMNKTIKPAGVTLSATGEKARNTQVSLANYEFTRLRGMAHDIINTVDTFESRITAAEGNVSTLSQTVGSIKLEVTNGVTTSTIKLMKDNVAVSSPEISFSGLVSFTDLSTSGNTSIHGDNIQTGTLSASKITTGELSANRIKGGTLTLGGYNNTYGYMAVKDSNDAVRIEMDRLGLRVFDSSNNLNTNISSQYGYITTTGIGFGYTYENSIINMGSLTYGASDGIYLSSVNKLKITSGTNMSIDSLNNDVTGVVHICTSIEAMYPQQLIMGTDVSGYRTKIYLKGDVYVNGTLLPYY